MNLIFRQIFIVLAALCISITVPAQEIPLLPGDPAVVKGVMPNGMEYYLVGNPTTKSVADFALVQKTGRLTAPEDSSQTRTEDLAGKAFSSLRRVGPKHAKVCMAHLGVIPGRSGFAEVTDDATIFEFNNVRLDVSNALDSTLLILMDIADMPNYHDDGFLRKWYSPADQAVIVSGDIDPSAVAAKLTSMSYMVPSRPSAGRPSYENEDIGGTAIINDVPGNRGLKEISATWTSERVPREYMNTVQPEIFEMALNTLGATAAGRLKMSLKGMDIPVADVSYEHNCSSEYPYDDSFTLKVTVAQENAAAARDAMASVMASIKTDGAMANEFLTAESSYIQHLIDKASVPVRSNGEYIDICRNAFLYNSSLASSREKLDFHTSRTPPDTMRQRLFNGIAAALIDTLWTPEHPAAVEYEDITIPDTLVNPVAPVKIKLKSSKREPVSGGSIWTFSNGFRVIYKKMASDRMYYSLALNGGYGNIKGLKEGEGAFVADYFGTCRVSGMEADDFVNALRMKGLTMDMNVGLSNTQISGNASYESMPLLMRSLLAVANERTADTEEFEYYMESEYLALDMAQGSLRARMTAIDSIMCPGYAYSPYKVRGRISEGFRDRAEAFYGSQFAKMNDGALILAGNMNEEKLKKILLDYVGHFRTSGKMSERTSVHYQPVSGWSTYTVDGAEDNVDIAYSARMPFTMDNYMAAEIASDVIRQRLTSLGINLSISSNCRIYPEERVNVFISFPEASLKTLSEIRSVLGELLTTEISDEELKPYKETVKHRTAQEMKSPAYWLHAIALRYLDGKDVSTGYAARIDAVTPAKVRYVLDLLNDGCKVEYVTIKR